MTVTSDGVLLTPTRHGLRRWTAEPTASIDSPYVTLHEIGGPDSLVFEMRNGRATQWVSPAGDAVFLRAGPLSDPYLLLIVALTVAVAAIAGVGGMFLRNHRDLRQTTMQARANAAQVSGSVLWLTGLLAFCIWRGGISDPARLAYDWPGPWLVIASSCAFIASVMTVICLILLPVAWRGGRRLDSWTNWHKVRFSVTALIFALFSLMLGFWGALEPWRR